LAAGTTEGKIFMIEHKADNWTEPKEIGSHSKAVTGLSWGPSTEPAFLNADQGGQMNKGDSHEFTLPVKRLVSGSDDKMIFLWEFHQND
jgi:hypothetical protein